MTWTIDTPAWPTRPRRDDNLTTDQILDVLDLVGQQGGGDTTSEEQA